MNTRLWKNFDWLLLFLVVITTCFGITAIASATQFRLDDPSTWGYVTRQATWFGIGLCVLLFVVFIDYQVYQRWYRLLYLLNLGLLASVLIIGRSALGAQRWIDIGPLQFQPSEVAKILVILTLAHCLAKYDGKMDNTFGLVWAMLHILPPMLLIMLQPDLGTALVFVAIALGMIYMAGYPGLKLAGLVGMGAAAAVLWIVAHLNWGVWIPLEDYQLQRLLVFIDPSQDPFGSGYHIIQSRIAIGSGQMWGQGLFQGTQNQLNYLPEQQTDFIFAVVGEELGFIGGASLIALLCLLILRSLNLASRARDTYGALLIVGCVSMIGFQILVNMGMTMGIMPVTGIPLPFISYGGTSLLTNYVAVGLILNVYMRRQKIIF